MAQTQFALAWDAHQRNICHGLSSLQQNGEFVDMTLAADGHLVKVHQVIIALASPYIKELMSSAQCPHPIIFLNRISYTTLCSILEYIYTGEVLVSSEDLNELIEAGKELHIRGLEDMKITQSTSQLQPASEQSQNEEDDVCYFEISNNQDKDEYPICIQKAIHYEDKDISLTNTLDKQAEEFTETMQEDKLHDSTSIKQLQLLKDIKHEKETTVMQYTVSNQGSLQMILNRFVYYLKHTNRNNSRQWRCVDYVTSIKCPAHVVTKDDMVVQRISAHTHPFHDRRILKKVHAGSIFSAINDAEKQGMAVNCKRMKLSFVENEEQ